MRTLATSLLVVLFAATTHAQSTPAPAQDADKIRKAAQAAVDKRDWDTAAANFQKLVEVNPQDGSAWHMLGYTLHGGGKWDEALKAHIKATEFKEVAPVANYNVACVYALQGKKDQAFQWLAKAAKAGFSGAEHMETDSDMDALRGDPRYQEIVAQIESNASNPAVQVYAMTGARQMSRVVMFAGRGSVGGASVSYGQPAWHAKYDQMIKEPKYENHRWRLGKDEWTTLDTSVAMQLGDQELQAGIYYLTLARRGSDFVLAALEPKNVHKHTIDPYMAHLTTGGTEVVLTHEKVDEVADTLEIDLVQKAGTQGAGDLVIRFGPHKLSAPFGLQAKTGGHDK
jgi:hypothetical protein